LAASGRAAQPLLRWLAALRVNGNLSSAWENPMADVFISYASEDRERARELASALEACGWSVWWDRKIIAGQTFDQAIERELGAAKSVVVLWSKDSISSEWVRNEAAAAAERGVLVPALLDAVSLPLEFRRRQAADLIGWGGDLSHGGFRALCDGIAAKAAPGNRAAPRQSAPSIRASIRPDRRWILGAVAVIAIALGGGAYWGWMRGAQPRVADEATRAAERAEGPRAHADLADAVVGTYFGAVVADSKGSSRSDVTVTISKVNPRRVRITSDYERLGTVEVELTRAGHSILSAGGDAVLVLDVEKNPPHLDYNPGGVAYGGEKQ
jgi:hypothetical protein